MSNRQQLQEKKIKVILWKTHISQTNWCCRTFFVSSFSWHWKGGILIGCGIGHRISSNCEGSLRDQPRHQGNKPASFDAPFWWAVWTRHAEMKAYLFKVTIPGWAASTHKLHALMHWLISDGVEAFIVDSSADFSTVAFCWDTEKKRGQFE